MSSFSGQTYPTLAETLSNQLTEDQLRQWGFVIIRTTCSAEAKWAEFLAIINDSIRFWCSHPDHEAHSYLYDKYVMTVLEDAATLSDANLSFTARVFTDWINSLEAQAEREGTKLSDTSMCSARYHFYIHTDEATVQQVLDQHAKREAVPKDRSYLRSSYLYENKNLFTVKVIHAGQVMIRQEVTIQEQGPDADTDVIEEKEEEDELLDMVKRVRIFQIPELYAVLSNLLDRWFDLLLKGDVCEI